jgi:hypothetical protein
MKLYNSLLSSIAVLVMIAPTSCDYRKNTLLKEKQALVFDHYKNDSLKLKAARFLMAELATNVHVENGILVQDYNTVDAKSLIENIDSAYAASETLLKHNIVDFENFSEYVLPYNINYAKPEAWRKMILKDDKAAIIRKSKTKTEIINSINKINSQLLPNYKFDTSNDREDTLSYSEILKSKKGSCTTMANLAQYYYRALGIPVSQDFVIVWGNTSGGHAWNSLILHGAEELSFLGLEQKLKNYNPLLGYGAPKGKPQLATYKKPGKIFRRTYTSQVQSLAFKYKGTPMLPDVLREYRLIDITSRYIKTRDISTKSLLNSKSKILLICNYNTNSWIPVAAAENRNDNFIFKDMGVDMLYLFSEYNHNEYNYISFPIVVDAMGQISQLKPGQKRMSLKVNHLKSVMSDQNYFSKKYNYESAISVAENHLRRNPIKGNSYTLFYWNNKWQKCGTEKALGNDEIVFKNIPANSLYLISENGKINSDDRPFVVKNDHITWL